LGEEGGKGDGEGWWITVCVGEKLEKDAGSLIQQNLIHARAAIPTTLTLSKRKT
jgi:hypothetical protein